jgi:hypothetical protein
MTHPVSQAAISNAYFPFPIPEKNSQQTTTMSTPERATDAGIEMKSRLPGLIAGLAEDAKTPDKAIDIIEQTCGKIIAELDAKIVVMNEKQTERQGAVADLLAITTALGNYKNAHPTQKGAIDLSGLTVTLSEASPLYAAGKRTMPLAELIDYYRQRHSELALPHMPTTVDELNFLSAQIGNALQMSLEPASQATYTELQLCVQDRRAMQEMQSTMIRLIFDAFKKFVSGM